MSLPPGTVTEEAAGLWRIALPRTDAFLESTNVYVVQDGGAFVLVDSGENTPLNQETLFSAFAYLGVERTAIRNIYLTHAHHDHLGLSAQLAEESGATVWAHTADLEYLQQRFVEVAAYQRQVHAWIRAYGATPDEADNMVIGLTASHRELRIPRAHALADGEQRQVGPYTFTIRWTPGHTPGHVCLFEPAHGIVLCGDHVLERVSTHVGMQPYSDENPLPRYLAILAELAAEGDRTALPGHGEAFTTLQDRAQALQRHQHARREAVLDALAHGERTAIQVAQRLWAETRPFNWATFHPYLRRNSVAQVIAHLEMLRAEGLVQRSDEPPYRYQLGQSGGPTRTATTHPLPSQQKETHGDQHE